MRIAILAWESLHSIHVGGLGVAVTRLAEELAKLGHEVYLFTRRRKGQPRHSRIQDVHYYRCAFNPGHDIIQFFFNMSRAMQKEVIKVSRGGGRFDIIHGHDWHVVHALCNLKMKGYPVVLSYHSTEYGRRGGAIGEDKQFREIHGWEIFGGEIADRVITVSRSMERELIRICRIPKGKIDIVPNGIDVHNYQIKVDASKFKKENRIPEDQKTVLFAGRLEYQKGPDLLLKAVPEVLKHHPNVLFLFTGAGSKSRGLKRQARKYISMGKVRFLGWVPYRKYLALLNICDLMCIPSRQEPFGIVLLEGWATGRPMVVTNVGGLAENVKHLVNGFKVKPNPESIAQGICYLLEHPEIAKCLGEKGRKSVKKFSWKNSARKVLRSYRMALEEHSKITSLYPPSA